MRKKTMTLDQYKKRFNEAPYSLEEFAEGALSVPELRESAQAYLTAKEEFEQALADNEIEMG